MTASSAFLVACWIVLFESFTGYQFCKYLQNSGDYRISFFDKSDTSILSPGLHKLQEGLVHSMRDSSNRQFSIMLNEAVPF